ncbi:UPF0470 protein C19orf51 [Fasciola gigantica]|uniref:UPF0470 protein C19orf51 n=1 Tax=Fasciola gigantica TaxID=46835 RepID=A0A504YG30_FASGI|nr:UPF0470 protein C19orf51 [Fasciola gigantica]
MFTRTTLSFIIASLLTCSHSVTGQFDHCLRPSGCHGDDCCFNVVSKTGPICDPIPGCAALFPNDCCRNARPVHTDYGIFYGYAIQLDTAFGYEESGQRYLEIWRGIPYARPPTRENNLRFRRPVHLPQGRSKYDATYFRDDCPQPDAGLTAEATVWTTSPHEWARRVPLRQTEGGWHTNNEDCLYMNIYVLNETTSSDGARQPSSRKKLPVLVVFDGMDHLTGTGNRYPGHALAQLGLVVVFVNYRLGPFGYLATDIPPGLDTGSDDSADVVRGNYALWDQVMALKFIRENIHLWLGDKNQVTVLGHGSAAADVALHLLSIRSGRRDPPLFHRAVLLSGADQMEGGFIRNPEEPMAYTVKLAQQVGCDAPSRRQMLDCLRARTASELATAAGQTRIHRPNWRTKPWAPTMDGDFLTADPKSSLGVRSVCSDTADRWPEPQRWVFVGLVLFAHFKQPNIVERNYVLVPRVQRD